jgi:hypothetical protein
MLQLLITMMIRGARDRAEHRWIGVPGYTVREFQLPITVEIFGATETAFRVVVFARKVCE